MTARNATRAVALACLSVALAALAKEHATHEDGADAKAQQESPHTITWWCVDLNDLWHVDVPVIVGAGVLTPPDPSPVPICTDTSFPVTVKAGSGWTAGPALWIMNKTYPPAVAAVLEASGYHFVANSPHEDLMMKIVEVRYVVRTFPENDFVSQFSFDPRRVFRLIQTRQFFGARPLDPLVNPDLGIDIDADAVGRLPLLHFPGIGGGLPPGQYRAQVFWVISELHNDGLGLDEDENFLPAGDLLLAQPRFVVAP